MMRQTLGFVVLGPPSVWLSRMNGFSPVRITRFGSAGIAASSLQAAREAMLGHGWPCRSADDRARRRAPSPGSGQAPIDRALGTGLESDAKGDGVPHNRPQGL